MLNINLATLSNEELKRAGKEILVTYESNKSIGYTYGGIQLNDLKALEKNLQRASMFNMDAEAVELHKKTIEILKRDTSAFSDYNRQAPKSTNMYEAYYKDRPWLR